MVWRKKKRLLKVLIAFVVTAFLLLLTVQNQSVLSTPRFLEANQPGLYKVTSFYDGDTLEVDMNGIKEKVRLIGVDTPETHDPRKTVQCYGKAASGYTKNLIGSSRIRLESDPINTNRDRYNRLLRYVYLPNGTLVNNKLIQDGYGFAYTYFPFTKLEEFSRLQQSARQQNKGLWGNCPIVVEDNGQIHTGAAN